MTPGSLNGKKPKTYGKGRRCRCGVSLTQYTQGEWCNACSANPDRMRQFEQTPKGPPMKTMTTKQVKEHLGLGHVREVRDLADAGKIEMVERGRGLWGAKFAADSVLDYENALKEPGEEGAGGTVRVKQIVDAGYDVPATEEEVASGKATRTFDEGEDLPEPGDDDVTDAQESERGRINRLMGEFGAHMATHLAAVEVMHDASDRYRESFAVASHAGSLAFEVQTQLQDLGIDVAPAPYGPPVLLVPAEEPPVDAEVAAMLRIRDALDGLDRDAQLRVVRWALSRFDLDRPAPTTEVRADGGEVRQIPV